MYTYNALGQGILPTIINPSNAINPGYPYVSSGVAVDASDNHYFTNDNNTLTIWNAAGSIVNNAITTGLDNPLGVAVDSAGKIYVVNGSNNTVTTYTANGTQTTPTITTGLNDPTAVAVDAAGNIYVTNVGNGTVTTYAANGTQITTITGLAYPTGIAVR